MGMWSSSCSGNLQPQRWKLCFSWIPDSQVPDFCRRLLWVILGSSITHHQASKGISHIQVQDCLCHVCFALNFSVVVVETFFPGVIYKRCFDSGSMWVVCVSGSAHSALPTVLLLPLCSSLPFSAQCLGCPLHLCLLAPSLPPTASVLQHWRNLLDPQLFLEGENCVAAAVAAGIAANYMRIQIIWALVSERYSLSQM